MKNLISLVSLSLSLTFALCGCAGSSGGDASAAARTPAPAQPTTRQMAFYHGLGFVCWVSDARDKLWCWASDPIALTDGNAAAAGLSSIVPTVLANTPPGVMDKPVLTDHSIYYKTTGIQPTTFFVQGTASGTTNTWTDNATCDVTASDSVHCALEAVSDLTFSGIVIASVPTCQPVDPQIRHYPHSPTWKTVRSTACHIPHIKSEGALAAEGVLFSGGQS